MKKLLASILICFAAASCAPVLNTFYGVNKNQSFDSKHALAEHYVKKNKLERERIYFFTSNNDREAFMMGEIIGKGKNEYYGIQLNDSTMVYDTEVSRQWCMGVVGSIITDSTSYHKVKISNIKNYKLVNIDGQSVNFNTDHPTVIFVISTNSGRLINKNIGYVVNHINETEVPVDYIYIAVDFLPEYKAVNN
jgi:hypothetical protein